jgi:CRISPR-associated endonuclease Csy4
MEAFIDIRLLADPEFPVTILMNTLFKKLHKRMVSFGAGAIGISFPDLRERSRLIGSRLRLHGTHSDLQRFMQPDWLTGMRDHISVGKPEPIPSSVRHRVVRRVQAKSSPTRERRRLTARKGISEEEARIAIPDSSAEMLNLPFLVLNSGSTRQQFRLFIEHLPLQDKEQSGKFNAYGLSVNATIPWF